MPAAIYLNVRAVGPAEHKVCGRDDFGCWNADLHTSARVRAVGMHMCVNTQSRSGACAPTRGRRAYVPAELNDVLGDHTATHATV